VKSEVVDGLLEATPPASARLPSPVLAEIYASRWPSPISSHSCSDGSPGLKITESEDEMGFID